MHVRVIEPKGTRQPVLVDLDEEKTFEEHFRTIEKAFNDPYLFQKFRLYPSVYVDPNSKRIRVVNEVILGESTLQDIDLTTKTLILKTSKANHVDAATPTSSKIADASTESFNTYRNRLLLLYSVYDPDKVRCVDGTLKKYKGREEAVIQHLVRKYGPEPDPLTEAVPIVSVSSDVAADPSPSIQNLLASPISEWTISPTISEAPLASWNDGPTFLSPSNSSEPFLLRKRLTRIRSATSKLLQLRGSACSTMLLARYFSKWSSYLLTRDVSDKIERGVWKRSSNGFTLVDNVTPILEVSDLGDYLKKQRSALANGGVIFSDQLQKALRELLSIVRHLPSPLGRETHEVPSTLLTSCSKDDFTAFEISPVKDTHFTANTVRHASRLLHYLYSVNSELEKKQLVYTQMAEESKPEKERNKQLLKAESKRSPSSAVQKQLENQVQELQAKLEQELAKKKCSDSELDEKKQFIVKLQLELAKARTQANKLRENEQKLKEKCECLLAEKAKLCQMLKLKELSKHRTTAAVDQAKSENIRSGLFSDPLATHLEYRTPVSPRKASRRIVSVNRTNSIEPPSSVHQEVAVIGNGDGIRCPLCEAVLKLCSKGCSSAQNRERYAAFCFSCRRSFRWGDLL